VGRNKQTKVNISKIAPSKVNFHILQTVDYSISQFKSSLTPISSRCIASLFICIKFQLYCITARVHVALLKVAVIHVDADCCNIKGLFVKKIYDPLSMQRIHNNIEKLETA